MGDGYSANASSSPQQVSNYLYGMRNCFIGRAMKRGFDRDSAEDSFQHVAFAALNEISRGNVFVDIVSLRKWAYRVHTNYCTDVGRKRGRQVSLGEHDPEASNDFVEELTRGEDVKALTEAIERLPEIYRDAIKGVLREESYLEISSSQTGAFKTTRTRIHRAKKILKGQLESVISS